MRQAPGETILALRELATQHPDCPEVFETLAEVYTLTKNSEQHQAACERLAELQPRRADVQFRLASAYVENQRMMLGLLALRQFQRDFPNSTQHDTVQNLIDNLEPYMAAWLDGSGLGSEERCEEIAALHERTLSAVNREQFAAACEYAEASLAIKPDFITGLNNLSIAEWYRGNLERAQACAAQALAIDPDNLHARGNQIRYWVLAGERDRAHAAALKLLDLDQPAPDRWVKIAETFAFLSEPELILTAYERAQTTDAEEKDSLVLKHLAAYAHCKLGNLTQARQLWEQVIDEAPNRLAQQNYEDLLKPASDRRGPWALALNQWVPQPLRDLLQSAVRQLMNYPDTDPDALEAEIKAAVQSQFATSGLLPIAPRMLRDGGPDSHKFLFAIARLAKSSELWELITDYALSDHGPDLPRMEAAQTAVQAGALPSGEVSLWVEGKQRPILMMAMTIDDEVDAEPHPPDVERLVIDALNNLRASEYEAAIPLLLEAQALKPEADDIEFNLASSYLLTGRRDEGCKLLETIHARNPDYPNAAIALAQLHIQDKDLDAADALLRPLLARPRLHFEVFSQLCNAEVELAIAHRSEDALNSWLSMWERVYPEDPRLEVWQDSLEDAIAAD
ncbi:MAG: tetratricopeptide repeat protein [Spirulinaceae cyanobacterium RM2_2_10]|nr:tetratricopeptide repeat protein [Spirulinaceae cyanobacterium RM2_2_10]